MIDERIFNRILKAFGIDPEDRKPTINQYQYVALYAFIRYSSLSEEQQIVIWIRIFDPINAGRIERAEYEQVLR